MACFAACVESNSLRLGGIAYEDTLHEQLSGRGGLA